MAVGFAVLSIGTVLMAEKPTPLRCGGVGLASFALVFPFLVIAIVTAETSRFILKTTGYDLELVDAFSEYAAVLAWAIAPALVFAVLKNVLNAVGKTGVLVWLSVGIVLGNLLISIALVHGIGSWSGLGVAGAAWGTLAVNRVTDAANCANGGSSKTRSMHGCFCVGATAPSRKENPAARVALRDRGRCTTRDLTGLDGAAIPFRSPCATEAHER